MVSAPSFTVGAVVPVIVMAIAPAAWRVAATMVVTLVGLVGLGLVGARLGGAAPRRAAIRVLVGGALALGISLAIGRVTGSVI